MLIDPHNRVLLKTGMQGKNLDYIILYTHHHSFVSIHVDGPKLFERKSTVRVARWKVLMIATLRLWSSCYQSSENKIPCTAVIFYFYFFFGFFVHLEILIMLSPDGWNQIVILKLFYSFNTFWQFIYINLQSLMVTVQNLLVECCVCENTILSLYVILTTSFLLSTPALVTS